MNSESSQFQGAPYTSLIINLWSMSVCHVQYRQVWYCNLPETEVVHFWQLGGVNISRWTVKSTWWHMVNWFTSNSSSSPQRQWHLTPLPLPCHNGERNPLDSLTSLQLHTGTRSAGSPFQPDKTCLFGAISLIELLWESTSQDRVLFGRS